MKKAKFTLFMDPEMLSQLTAFADRKGQPKSLVAEAAIASFLAPDAANQNQAVFARRLDVITRQVERLERDHSITLETLALFIRIWLIIAPSLPESAQAAAQAKGRERYESFLETLGRRLAKGQTFLSEVSVDKCDVSIPSQEAAS
jgi:hypothetical protein